MIVIEKCVLCNKWERRTNAGRILTPCACRPVSIPREPKEPPAWLMHLFTAFVFVAFFPWPIIGWAAKKYSGKR